MPKSQEFPLARYADKEPTELHERFAEWIEEQTGYEPDLKSVQLASTTRMVFQKSDENQKNLAERREHAEQLKEERAAKRVAKREAVIEAKAKADANVTETKTAPTNSPKEKPLSAKRAAAKKVAPAKKAPAKKAPAKKAASPRGRKKAEATF